MTQLKQAFIDCADCDSVEVIVGKQGGTPLIKGTRVPDAHIVEEFDFGSPLEEIAEKYPTISREKITILLAFAERHRS